MNSGAGSPYEGSSSILLAVGLLIVTSTLVYFTTRFHDPIAVKRPGRLLGVALLVTWVLSVTTLLVAAGVYVLALSQQVGQIPEPTDSIAPVTLTSGLVAFWGIAVLTQRSGFWVAVGSAIVGTIAAPMIFELPFDLIVTWRTFPPTPEIGFTLLFFLPLFSVEIVSFAMLAFSPVMKLSRSTLFLLAGMFLIFAVWALFGFAYPATPLPTALNMIAKVLAFATAVSLFLPRRKSAAPNRAFSAALVIVA